MIGYAVGDIIGQGITIKLQIYKKVLKYVNRIWKIGKMKGK